MWCVLLPVNGHSVKWNSQHHTLHMLQSEAVSAHNVWVWVWVWVWVRVGVIMCVCAYSEGCEWSLPYLKCVKYLPCGTLVLEEVQAMRHSDMICQYNTLENLMVVCMYTAFLRCSPFSLPLLSLPPSFLTLTCLLTPYLTPPSMEQQPAQMVWALVELCPTSTNRRVTSPSLVWWSTYRGSSWGIVPSCTTGSIGEWLPMTPPTTAGLSIPWVL